MAEETIKADGIVKELLSNGLYRVELENGGHEIIAHVKGKMRMYNIRILQGDNSRLCPVCLPLLHRP